MSSLKKQGCRKNKIAANDNKFKCCFRYDCFHSNGTFFPNAHYLRNGFFFLGGPKTLVNLESNAFQKTFRFFYFEFVTEYIKPHMPGQHLAAYIREVFADGYENYNPAALCCLTAVMCFQTSPAHTATLRSIWATTTRTEQQTSRQRPNCFPLAPTDCGAHRDLLQT